MSYYHTNSAKKNHCYTNITNTYTVYTLKNWRASKYAHSIIF